MRTVIKALPVRCISSGTSFVQKLWYVSVFISEKVLSNFILHFENAVFGYFIQDNVNNKAFVINLFIDLQIDMSFYCFRQNT